MIWRLLVGCACIVALQCVGAELKLEYQPPDFLEGPVVANSMLGTTYAYRASELSAPTTLQITVVMLPKAALVAGEFSTEHCIELFLTEVARNQPGFFAVPVEATLVAGDLHLQQVRWIRKDTVAGMTGVTSCGLDHDRYVSISFQDSLKRATNTFPAIRNSLKALAINQ